MLAMLRTINIKALRPLQAAGDFVAKAPHYGSYNNPPAARLRDERPGFLLCLFNSE
jgi:hypothetical protein